MHGHPGGQKLLRDDDSVRLAVVNFQAHMNVPELFVFLLQVPEDPGLTGDILCGQLDEALLSGVRLPGDDLPHAAVGKDRLSLPPRSPGCSAEGREIASNASGYAKPFSASHFAGRVEECYLRAIEDRKHIHSR